MATAKTKRVTRSKFNRPGRVRLKAGKITRTKQSFKDECDINKIMAKYQRTGAVTHFNRHSPQYGFASADDFAQSMRIVTQAQEMFEDLPSSIRQRFSNSPENFLAFVQNPENASEMETLGLTTKKAESPPGDAPAAPEGDPQPPAGPPEDPPTG